MTKFSIKMFLFSLTSALFVGVAAAQTVSAPTGAAGHPATVGYRQLLSIRQQIGSRENNERSRRDRAVQSEIDHLYNEIMRAAMRRGR